MNDWKMFNIFQSFIDHVDLSGEVGVRLQLAGKMSMPLVLQISFLAIAMQIGRS